MKKLVLLIISLSAVYAQSALALRCNNSCTYQYPCIGTIQEPFRMCEVESQSCVSERNSCRNSVFTCVRDSLVRYNVSYTCVQAVYSIYISPRGDWQTAGYYCQIDPYFLSQATAHCK